MIKLKILNNNMIDMLMHLWKKNNKKDLLNILKYYYKKNKKL